MMTDFPLKEICPFIPLTSKGLSFEIDFNEGVLFSGKVSPR
jgi:hypothetical protein